MVNRYMCWDGTLYIHTTLPFGLRSAPKIFAALADTAELIIRQAEVEIVIHYLDDFLVIGVPGTSECSTALRTLIDIFHLLAIFHCYLEAGGPNPKSCLPGFRA